MSIHAAITHRTSYHYDRPIALGPQTIRLRPAPHSRTPIISYALKIEPAGHFVNWQQDPQGNFLARIVFPERVTHFEVTVDLVADMATINPFDFFLEPEAETYPFAYDPVLEQELAPFRKLAEPGPLLAALLAEIPLEPGQRMIDMLVGINRIIQERVGYIVRLEPGVQTPEETLELAKGSCRDSAWLLVHTLRHLGFAARFVSGYLIQLVADMKSVTGPSGPTTDFTDLHAWAEVYLPGAGWIGLDATSGLLTGEGHIPLACSPEPGSAAPISGLVEKAEVTFGFEMILKRVSETPRTTLPYGEDGWRDILAAGARVERALQRQDIRLTMGGEPTFIAADDMDGAEWSVDALGPTKRVYANRLLKKLAALWSPGHALQLTLGKHYPGEQLPRWALTAHWRADGEPIWNDQSLLATDDDDEGATTADAARFCAALAERLQVAPGYVTPAHEDIHYYLWRENRLPANVVVEDSKLKDEAERARLVRVYAGGLNKPVGSVLPLRRIVSSGLRRWQSGRWFLKSDHLFLAPGDAPVGFRLPLQSLAWAEEGHVEHSHELDPFAHRNALPPRDLLPRHDAPGGNDPVPTMPLPSYQALLRGLGRGSANGAGPGLGGLFGNYGINTQELPVVGREEPGIVRTALAVEAREGRLHVFFPPLYDVEDWLDLAAAVEQTATEFGTKIVLEGYPPPSDPRVLNFSVTPDPGVIEVNVHPAENWDEQVTRTEQLYEEARQLGLATEKFMLDGRHVGTGGGNHVVMGGARAEDSPFLRRPDLLKSLLGFWHNHPSLSFLFSGLFIGPSSQHPRIDEARQDSLAELDIAFAQVSPFKQSPPWLTDRLFRNILADMTGNTHRTEFCIDKMYAPESASGRRGLVEFRAFEMPPHARMSAAQMLFMRNAIAAFWQSPYDRRLIRWGTRLHDDFMLPHYVWQDLTDALDELGTIGFGLDAAWYEPHWMFRFPVIGAVDVLGMHLELRNALEPWHVLGEEPASGGTVRFVDSSVERVQVRVTGFSPERYTLVCNGEAVPLSATQRQGEFVAGVRFKAWKPPSSIHPTIDAQSPLVFDLYDTWSERSLGGFTYYVSHPGGRNYERFPVNANEAEARRRARFFAFGHTAGVTQVAPARVGVEHPRTLDLRRTQVRF